jgi:inosine/xanthosine triphosphate pyrophosphatase family protein
MKPRIYFITGNKNKFAEVKNMLPEVEQLELDLEEIQEFDAHKVIQAKMKEAFKHYKSGDAFIIEDTSLYLDGLNGLPGPLINCSQ